MADRDVDLDRVAATSKIIGSGTCAESGKLVVLAGMELQKVFELTEGGVQIGSHGDNHVVIDDPTVSRQHACMEKTASGCLIRDLDSTNGTYLNGLRVREAFLEHGAIIALGNTRLQFVPVEEETAIPPAGEKYFGEAFGDSLEMRRIFTVLKKVSPSDVTVTIEGETGTGKEVIARSIHSKSRRASKPFEVIDCSSISRSLIESELFGHEKGAFTGATRSRPGAFERANGGTVFIDELGELDLDLQPRLLRALERQEVKRVGGDRTIKVDVRVIAATNRDLYGMVRDAKFREDLFYRISVVRIQLPPLRDRREDIPCLAQIFANDLADQYSHKHVDISPEAIEVLKGFSWPGNVRELRNFIARAMAMADGPLIQPGDFLLPTEPEKKQKISTLDVLAGRSLDEVEKAAIKSTLKAHDGNKSAAARALGIAYSTLYEKIKKYGLS